jgi:hypothetical protein
MEINKNKAAGPVMIDLPKIEDIRGNLSYIEEENQIPFKIRRVYWIYDVPGGEIRGGHAFKEQKEFIVALSGSFDIIIHNGKSRFQYHLNRSYFGLYVPNRLWRHMENFSTNSVVMILSSTNFNEDDYIDDFNKYLKFMK